MSILSAISDKKRGKFHRLIIAYMGLSFVVWIFSILHIRAGPEQVTNVDMNNIPYTSKVPRNIKECIVYLDEWLSDEDREKIIFYNEEHVDGLTQLQLLERPFYGHPVLGMTIRNNWGLWTDSRLKRWFFWRGNLNPDSISGVILAQYISHIKGEEVNYLLASRIIVLNVITTLIGIPLFLASSILRKCRQTSSSRSKKNKIKLN